MRAAQGRQAAEDRKRNLEAGRNWGRERTLEAAGLEAAAEKWGLECSEGKSRAAFEPWEPQCPRAGVARIYPSPLPRDTTDGSSENQMPGGLQSENPKEESSRKLPREEEGEPEATDWS